MTIFALALHILGATVWVGGMFFVYLCLRPALATLDAPQRLVLLRDTLQHFFRWVWLAVALLLISGYWMLFVTYGGFSGAGVHIHIMHAIGWLMIALFVWLVHGPWPALKRAVDDGDWPAAAPCVERIRQIVVVNLPLGLLLVAIGGTGRYWG